MCGMPLEDFSGMQLINYLDKTDGGLALIEICCKILKEKRYYLHITYMLAVPCALIKAYFAALGT